MGCQSALPDAWFRQSRRRAELFSCSALHQLGPSLGRRNRDGECSSPPRRRAAADAKGCVFPYHATMVESRQLTKAMARLDALTDWERRPRSTMRVGLEPMLDLAARLGDPEKSFRSIHVAGTKGKGSVSALIEAALVRAGVRVGRYASPHVERVTERVSLDGREIDEPTLSRALDRALDAYEAARKAATPAANATWFDLLTAAAFSFSLKRNASGRWSKWGLGGRLDSTNIVDGEIAIVTNIELEHTEILGKTRAAIAREKVGVLKAGPRSSPRSARRRSRARLQARPTNSARL